tara:strand:- start:450 stop:701 length:252 start_codon:yes stop_codon:yes gene_type:complete
MYFFFTLLIAGISFLGGILFCIANTTQTSSKKKQFQNSDIKIISMKAEDVFKDESVEIPMVYDVGEKDNCVVLYNRRCQIKKI